MERINPERIIEMKYLTLTSTASRIVDRIDLVTERINDTEELLEANSQAIPADQLEKAREIIEPPPAPPGGYNSRQKGYHDTARHLDQR